jgi:phage terminase large subunit
VATNAAIRDQITAQAKAERTRRIVSGTWQGAVRAHTEYQTDPVGWITDKLNVPERTLRWSMNDGYDDHDWDGDRDPIIAMLEAIAAGRDCGVEAATGTQKTYTAACITLWFLACFEDSIVQQWAPRADQLLLNVWKEIGRLWYRFQTHFPDAELLTGKIRMRPESDSGKEVWAASAMVAGVGADEEAATRAQGTHAQHLLIITEETPGIHPAIMKALDMTRTADHNIHLAIGNPDHRQDPLHQFCLRENVVAIRISALDHPNIVSGDDTVVPAAIGPRRLAERTTDYGKGSRLYNSRIRGISPAESSHAVISWDWCVAAAANYADPAFREGVLGLGADVAWSENGDKGAVADFQGRCVTQVVSMKCPDPNAFAREQVYSRLSDPMNPVDPRYAGIDPIGGGAGSVNELKRLGVKIRHLGGANKAVPGVDTDTLWSETETDLEGAIRPSGPVVIDAQRFNNLRSQIWWTLREDLRLGRLALPHDEELFMDLTTPEWEAKNGVICVEKKEEIVKRLKRSPDKGDAVAYGNFVRRRSPVRPPKAEAIKRRQRGDQEFGLEQLITRREKEQRARHKEQLKALKRLGRQVS